MLHSENSNEPYSLDGRLPQSMAEDVWLAPTAQVIGNVVQGREASIWFSAIVRGDNERS